MDKGGAVREMFGRIARRYDLVNSVMTAGVDALWRRRAVGELDLRPDARVLDLCCGTGALTRDCAARVPAGRVTGIDFAPQMLALARQHTQAANVDYREGDVLALPFEAATFDAATMGFSLRNVVDIGACLREIARVLKPGGTFVNLEVSKPANALTRRAFYAYFYGIVPIIGRLFGSDPAAYRYLPQSLVNYPESRELVQIFDANGFVRTRAIPLMGGVAALHVGITSGVEARTPQLQEAALS